jgi:hypothetical protein
MERVPPFKITSLAGARTTLHVNGTDDFIYFISMPFLVMVAMTQRRQPRAPVFILILISLSLWTHATLCLYQRQSAIFGFATAISEPALNTRVGILATILRRFPRLTLLHQRSCYNSVLYSQLTPILWRCYSGGRHGRNHFQLFQHRMANDPILLSSHPETYLTCLCIYDFLLYLFCRHWLCQCSPLFVSLVS